MDLGRVMYWTAPKVAEGFDLEDYLPDDVAVWPCHHDACLFFNDFCHTQWRAGAGGIAGLDYTAVLACIRALGLPRPLQGKLFADVRAIEAGALEAAHSRGED